MQPQIKEPITTILTRLSQQDAAISDEQLEKEMKKKTEEVEQKRVQRDLRYAHAMNAVLQARKHSGREVEIFSAKDAATVNIIYSLLQAVAEEPSNGIDKLFSGLIGKTVDAALELVVAKCTENPNVDQNTPDYPQSSDIHN